MTKKSTRQFPDLQYLFSDLNSPNLISTTAVNLFHSTLSVIKLFGGGGIKHEANQS